MIKYKNKKFDILISNDRIIKRLKNIASEINNFFKSKDVVILSIMDGSSMVFSEISKNFDINYEVNNVKLSSYNGGTKSTGYVRIDKNLEPIVKGKNVLIIEDIVDTGTTVDFLHNKLSDFNCKDVKIFSLLFKKSKYKYKHKIDWYGFIVDDEFVIGYGMDYEYKFRGLKDIYYMIDN